MGQLSILLLRLLSKVTLTIEMTRDCPIHGYLERILNVVGGSACGKRERERKRVVSRLECRVDKYHTASMDVGLVILQRFCRPCWK